MKVLEKTRDGLEVAVLPHNIPAFLPTSHLSDHVANGPLLYHWLQAGDTLHRVLCLSQSEGRIVSFTGIWGARQDREAMVALRRKLDWAMLLVGNSIEKSRPFAEIKPNFRKT